MRACENAVMNIVLDEQCPSSKFNRVRDSPRPPALYGEGGGQGPAATAQQIGVRRAPLQRIRMLSGLPGRCVTVAVFTGFIDTLRVVVRAGSAAAGVGSA